MGCGEDVGDDIVVYSWIPPGVLSVYCSSRCGVVVAEMFFYSTPWVPYFYSVESLWRYVRDTIILTCFVYDGPTRPTRLTGSRAINAPRLVDADQ